MASIVIDVCLILVLVVLVEFIRSTDERIWPIRVARAAALANLVLAVTFAAFVLVG